MKLFVAALFFLFADSNLFAGKDRVGSERPALWRSSRTCSAEDFVSLTTGTIHFHAVVIESPTVNVESFVSVYNSSSPANTTSNLNISTAIFQATYVKETSGDISKLAGMKTVYDVQLSSGGVINKIGNACIQCLWEYFVPQRIEHLVPLRP